MKWFRRKSQLYRVRSLRPISPEREPAWKRIARVLFSALLWKTVLYVLAWSAIGAAVLAGAWWGMQWMDGVNF
jgi:hypothetical protein